MMLTIFMNSTSLYNIKIDFEKSSGSYIFDKNTDRKYLDFMGMYSSLPLGYNHVIFDSSEWREDILRVSKLKIVNCEILSDEYEEFHSSFTKFTDADNVHFTCTGALANEAAIKTAMWYKGPRHDGYILSIKNSFHGINSVGNIITTRFSGIDTRLGALPGDSIWPKADTVNDAIHHIQNNERLPGSLQGIIIEPIQSTYGDNHLSCESITALRHACTEYDIPLIFDEVQTGFGSTGKVWYSQHLGVKPDITSFGKKSQVSGIVVSDSHSKVFEEHKRLSVTFDGDLVDMIRCKHIIKAIEKYDLLANAEELGTYFKSKLNKLQYIENVRSVGLLIAFDFTSKERRDSFCKNLYKNGMICIF